MRALRAALGTLAACAALLALAAPASASYQRPFVEVFGSAEEPTFEWPSLLAVDPSTGDLLVGDYNASSISRFKPNGEPDPFPALGTNVIDGKGGPGGQRRNAQKPEPDSCDKTPQNGIEVSFGGGRTADRGLAGQRRNLRHPAGWAWEIPNSSTSSRPKAPISAS